MSKKTIQIKEIEGPQLHEISKLQWSDEETAKIITELADFYGIEYELKIDKNMNKKTRRVNDLVKRESGENRTERIAELFKQEMQKAPAFKTITKFLWLPKSINGQWKWLVTASWQEQFVEVVDEEAMDYGASNWMIWVWKPFKWL